MKLHNTVGVGVIVMSKASWRSISLLVKDTLIGHIEITVSQCA